jgi:nucleotide-binding universal stress UspA family protein
MLKEILVCLEASPSTEAATKTAITIARDNGGKLVGLAIVDEPDIRAGSATGIGGASYKRERDDALVADAHKQAADWLALFERRCREAKVPAQALEVVGRPAAAILAETEKRDLTVMGRDANFRFETEGEDPQTRESILHHATRPVLLVPERPSSAPAELGKKVVIAYDGSGAAKRAISSFATSGLAARREIHVATVDDDGAEAWEMANKAVEMLKPFNVAATGHNIVSALSNIEALFAFATEIGAGLMVMGAFAHSRLKHLFQGSVTRGLVEKTTIPLYLQH